MADINIVIKLQAEQAVKASKEVQSSLKGAQKASPKAVMNALYVAPFRDLTGSDEGGHCSIWAQWPNN